MSKSLGNFFTVRDVLKKYDAGSGALLHPARALPQPAQLFRCAPGRRQSGADPALYRVERFDCETARRLGRAARQALQGGDGRRLRHAGSRGGAVRAGEPGEQRRKTAAPQLQGRLAACSACCSATPNELSRREERRTGFCRGSPSARLRASARTMPRPTVSARNSPTRASCSRTRAARPPGGANRIAAWHRSSSRSRDTLQEAIALLDAEGARPLSGGTALMLMMKAGVLRPARLVCLRSLGLEQHRRPTASLRIGAMTTLRRWSARRRCRKGWPVITRTLRTLSNVRVRNVATRRRRARARRSAHGPAAAAERARRARAVIAGQGGERTMPVEDALRRLPGKYLGETS